MEKSFAVGVDDSGQRLDIFCVGKIPQLSRAALQKAIKASGITVNGKVVKPHQTLKLGDEVRFNLPEETTSAPIPEVIPQNLPILYEDKDVVVINKPASVEVHPGQVPNQPAITAWFSVRYPNAQHVGEAEGRPGVVHRLDKDTSGVLILAKTNPAFEHLKSEFKNRRAKKEYLALVFGIPNMKRGRITRPIGRTPRNPLRRTISETGKPAVTEWQLEKKLQQEKLALLRLFPFTGRTHQLRVHLHFLGHPIVGDKLYTFKRQRLPAGRQARLKITRQLLHAEKLTLTLPSGKRKTFIAPLPDDFTRAINP